MPIYDFTCELGCGTHEKRVAYEVDESGCPECGGLAHRKSVYLTANILESAPVPLGDRRYNVSQFREASEELEHNHEREEQLRGKTLKAPSPLKYAMRKAKALDPEHFKDVGTDASKRRFTEQRGELKYNIDKKEQEVGQGLPGPNFVASEAARASGLDPHAQSSMMRKEISHRTSQAHS